MHGDLTASGRCETCDAEHLDRLDAQLAFVQLAHRFGEGRWITRLTSIDDAEKILTSLHAYNALAPDGVFDVLRRFWAEIGGVVIGEECSFVCYVDVPYWSHQTHAARDDAAVGTGVELSLAARRDLTIRLLGSFADAGADELTVRTHPTAAPDGSLVVDDLAISEFVERADAVPSTIRAWWD